MEPSFQEFITPLLGAIGGGFAAYAAIRADLAALKARVTIIEVQANKAHDRIDQSIQAHANRGHL